MPNEDGTLQLQGVYNSLYNATTRPDFKFVVTRYFIDEWLPLLGPSMAWLIVGLRQRCFQNQRRDWCIVDKASLARETALSERTIERNLKKPLSGWFVLDVTHRYRYRGEIGKTVRDKNRYQLLLDEPLSPRHQTGLVNLLRQVVPPGAEPVEAALAAIQTALDTPDLTDKISFNRPIPKELPRLTVLELVEEALDINLADYAHDKRLILLDQSCARLYNHIVQPNKIYVGWQYFRLNWVPLLGHALAWLIVYLRRRCFWDEKSGELRDVCLFDKKGLAAAIGQTPRNLANLLETPYTELFFTQFSPNPSSAPADAEGQAPRRASLHYQVRLVDEPLIPAHREKVAAELRRRLQGQHYSIDPESGQLSLFPIFNSSSNRQNFTYGQIQDSEKMSDRGEGEITSIMEEMSDRSEKMAVSLENTPVSVENVPVMLEDSPVRQVESGKSDDYVGKSVVDGRKNVATSLKDSFKDSSIEDFDLKIQQQYPSVAAGGRSLPELAESLKELSIQEPVLGQLLANPQLTATEVRAWFLYAETQAGLNDPRGYALKRLLAHDPPPPEFVIFARLDDVTWALFASLAQELRLGQPPATELPPDPEWRDTFITWAEVYAGLEPDELHPLLLAYASAENDPSTSQAELIPSGLEVVSRLWRTALDQLRFQMTKPTFDTWLRQTEALAREGDVFVVGVQNVYAKEWLENRLAKTIERTLASVVGEPVQVRFVLPQGAEGEV